VGQVVAKIISNSNSILVSRNPDFMIVNGGSDLIYVGKGVNYEETRRLYVLLDADVGTISLVFDVIDVFDAPTGLVLENNNVVYVVGEEEQEEYELMLQNHLELFALREKTVVPIVDNVPSGSYKLDFIVNEKYPFSLILTIEPKTTIQQQQTTYTEGILIKTTLATTNEINTLEKSNSHTSNSISDISKGALIGGVLALVVIIIILFVIVLKKPARISHEKYDEEMMNNPIFISPSNRSIIVANATYDYLNHPKPVYSVNNPLYDFNNNLIISPQLPLKMCQIDMVRSLANENTSELYGNIAEAKNIVVHDLNV